MVEQFGKRKPCRVGRHFESGVQLFAQGGVQRPVDKVVGLLHADVPTGFGEILVAQVVPRRDRPPCHLLVKQFGRPAAPSQRSAADGEDQPAVVECRMIDPRHPKVRRTALKR